MNRFFFGCMLSLFGCTCNVPVKKDVSLSPYSSSDIPLDTCVDFNSLNTKIRDGFFSKEEALMQVQTLIPKLKKYLDNKGRQEVAKSNTVFPVQGYKSNAIGGKNGSGYVALGYDYFDGNKHGGHPAHDIFIEDINQDCIDDNTKKTVNVLSMTGGIVIATENDWDIKSNLRGGKYIWIYDLFSNSFFYYAHNSKVLVQPCDIVKSGDTIAIVGRTGLNAFKKRLPTHLHIMQLKLDNDNYPRPVDCYKGLIN